MNPEVALRSFIAAFNGEFRNVTIPILQVGDDLFVMTNAIPSPSEDGKSIVFVDGDECYETSFIGDSEVGEDGNGYVKLKQTNSISESEIKTMRDHL